jgi:CHAT domain-containing protein/tetratricopeptide (TPR) repeat protein
MQRVRLVAATFFLVLVVSPFVNKPLAQHDDGLERARDLIASGRYADAVRYSQELSDRIETADGSSSPAFAWSLDVLATALIRAGRSAEAGTLAYAERAVSLKERRAPESVDLAVSLRNLGDIRAERGEFRTALTVHQHALEICERQLPSGDAQIADSLDRKAFDLMRLQKFGDAQEALAGAVSVREAHATDDSLALAGTLELVAWLHRYSGDYQAATAPIERALSIRNRLSPEHPALVSAMEVSGDLRFLQGRISDALSSWADALSLAERTLGGNHPIMATLQRRLAMASRALGDFVEARRQLERALQIAEHSMASCNPELPGTQEELARTLHYEGDYERARGLYTRAHGAFVACLGPTHGLTATVLHNMAELAVDVGDLDEAEQLQQRAIRSWSAGHAPSQYVARGLDALAEVFVARRDLVQARRLYERALAIRRQSAAQDGPDVAWTLTNLAQLNFRARQPSAALKYVDDAIAIYGRAGAADDPDHLARALALRVRVLTSSGDLTSARVTAQQALATRVAIFGSSHPLVAESRADLAAVDFGMGERGGSLAGALDAERIGRDHLRFTVRYLPERQAMTYAAKRPKGLDLALSVVAGGGVADASSVFEAVIQSRGVILDELAARARLATADPASSVLSSSLVSARQRFANLMLRSLQGEDSVPRALLDDARQQKEDAERAMAEVSAVARADLERARVGLGDVRGALPQGSALVSFIHYDRTVISKVGERTAIRMVPSYIAFVMRSDSPAVIAIPLGTATTIDAAVHAWREQAAGRTLGGSGDAAAEVAYRTAGAALRRQAWDRVAPYLGDAAHVLIAPDGSLNLVGFATLPTGARGYLAEQPRTIHYLSTERDLIPIERTASTAGLLAVGGASFDLRPAQPSSQPRSSVGLLRSGCGSLKSAHFDDLPGSREEVADIARVWRRGGFDQSTILTGRGATETAVKKAAVGRQVIHLATHGFFLGSDCDGAPAGTRAVGGLTSSRSGAPEQTENPLLLSGLALSGANNHIAATSPADDGILTAEEVASLNLQKTDWVVLSACDTGIGEVRPGEGVFGLRRAFQIAGARTVIMSLWSIDDQAARQWMRALYQDHFERHLSTADAMREASLSVLRARRASGQSTHPFYWGGFVAAGDWR